MSQPPSTPARPRWRRLAFALGLAVALAAASTAWMLRDPVPRIVARHGTWDGVTVRELPAPAGERAQDVEVRSTSGLRVQLAVRAPRDSSGATPRDAGSTSASRIPSPVRRRPVYLVLGGTQAGKGAVADSLLPELRGNILVGLQYPLEGSPRIRGAVQVLQAVPRARRAILDTPPAILLALDYLLSRPDVDPTRVELVGASFGAPFAAVAGALDPRITRVWFLHGGGDPQALIAQGLTREIPFAPARWLVAGLGSVVANGPRFAPEKWVGAISPRPIVMVNARNDERIPPASVALLWDAAAHPKRQLWMDGPHMQRNRPDVLKRLVDLVLTTAEAP